VNNVLAGFSVGLYGVPALEITDVTGATIYAVIFPARGANGRLQLQWTVPSGVTKVMIRMTNGGSAPTSGHFIISQPKFEFGSKMTTYVPGPNSIGP
jgi:hypothetical protein